MRVVIAHQRVEDHVVEHAQCVRGTGARNAPDQIETLLQIRATLVLVLHLRHHAQRLAKVFLMQALPLAFFIGHAVVALDQQELSPQHGSHLRPGRLELHGLSQRQAKAFVDHCVR